MMNFVKLTFGDGEPVWVSDTGIVVGAVHEWDQAPEARAAVRALGSPARCFVRETPEEVVKLFQGLG